METNSIPADAMAAMGFGEPEVPAQPAFGQTTAAPAAVQPMASTPAQTEVYAQPAANPELQSTTPVQNSNMAEMPQTVQPGPAQPMQQPGTVLQHGVVQPVQPAQAEQHVAQHVAQPEVAPTPGVVAQPAAAQPAVAPATVEQPAANPMIAQATTPQQEPEGFVPQMAPGQNFICQFSPAKFDALVKVLGILDDKSVIVIENSSICQSINNGTGILIADVSSLIEGNSSINLHILSPKKYLKYFKTIKGNSNIFVLDDPTNQRYLVTNGDITIYLPKQIEEFEKDAAPPDLSAATLIGQPLTIDKDVRSTITSMASESKFVDFLIHQNQLKAISVPEIAIYSFKDYIKEQMDENKAELKLRTYSFLKVAGEEYKIALGQVGDTFWSTTMVNTGFIGVHILEALQPVSDENLII